MSNDQKIPAGIVSYAKFNPSQALEFGKMADQFWQFLTNVRDFKTMPEQLNC